MLFDIGTDYRVVEDFLIKCGISRDMFGDQKAHTAKTIFDIAEEASKSNALVIPAHIDEYSGLDGIGALLLEQFYNLENINILYF